MVFVEKRHIRQSLIFSLLALLLLVSCQSKEHQIEAFRKQLVAEQEHAMRVTDEVLQALQAQSVDSLLHVAASADNILFYVFDRKEMVFWSDNWLAAHDVFLTRYDKWQFVRFDNAQGLCRWTKAGNYNVLTVLPLKTTYLISNRDLRNTFVPPFRLDEHIQMRQARVPDSWPVNDADGNYLFSLQWVEQTDATTATDEHFAASFSYQRLLKNEPDEQADYHREAHVYIIMCVVMMVALLIIGLVIAYRNKGFGNMSLRLKFQFLSVSLLLVTFAYVYWASITYVTDRYEARQIHELQKKAAYLQKVMQESFYFASALRPSDEAGMNIYLRDLCFSYETDINVYNMQGDLIGSSSPAIFEKGLVSRHLDPEPFFAPQDQLTKYKQIGDLSYLVSYVPLYNGSYVQFGFIEVPYYVTASERRAAIDEFLSRLLLPYLMVMILAIVLCLVICRRITQPLTAMLEAMRRTDVGKHNEHIRYRYDDEVGRLVAQYNHMVDQLADSTDRLARSEREGAWRTMARQIAHEINNPLTPMKLNIQQLQRLHDTSDERFDVFFQRSSRMLIEEIDNLSTIASSFSSFAKMPEVKTDKIDVATQLFSVITLFRTNQQKVPIRYVGAEYGVYAITDGEQIRQVFTNLLKNALQAIGGREDGDIIVILKDMGGSVEVSVSDNGSGIAEEIRERVFLPNFTTKSTGTGLGLAISKNIVDCSGGKIWFDTSDRGTTFYISLRK